eukprot:1568918-Rhodomonas_salina.1
MQHAEFGRRCEFLNTSYPCPAPPPKTNTADDERRPELANLADVSERIFVGWSSRQRDCPDELPIHARVRADLAVAGVGRRGLAKRVFLFMVIAVACGRCRCHGTDMFWWWARKNAV